MQHEGLFRLWQWEEVQEEKQRYGGGYQPYDAEQDSLLPVSTPPGSPLLVSLPA